MRRAVAFASAIVLMLATAPAFACPVCAQRDDGGVMRYTALAVLVAMPWLVALAVGAFIRRERLAVAALSSGSSSAEGER